MDTTEWRALRERSATTLDELAALLRERRAYAGSPSFSEIARRIADQRTARGVRASERSPGRITVYDCFRAGRRRIDTDLVLDIVRSLGADDDEAAVWREWCIAVQRPETAELVTARRDEPSVATPFVGRHDQLAAVRATSGPILVTGMPGAGKTQVAVRALHDLVAAGRIAGVVTVDLRASDMTAARVTAAALLDAVATALGTEPDPDAGLDERAHHVAAALGRENIALLVDDVGTWEQVAPLADLVVATPLVLVSRVLLAVPDGVQVVEVAPWSREDGLDLLRHVVGTQRVAAEPEAVDDILDLSGGLPLAAVLTAARIAGRTDWTLAEHRDALRARLENLRLDDPVSESIALSVSTLGADAQRALRLLATLPCESVPLDLLPAVLGDDAEAAAITAELTASHCAERPAPGRLGMHALVRAYASAQSWDEDPQGARDAALDRLADAAVQRAWSAMETLHPGHTDNFPRAPKSVQAMPREEAEVWLAAETGTLALLAEALDARRPEVPVGIAQAIGWYLDRQGLLVLGLHLHERALDCAQRQDDLAGMATAENAIGQARMRLGLADPLSHLERAAALAERAGLIRLGVSASNAMAILAAQAGDLAGSLARLEAGLEIARAHGIDDFAGAFLDNIAVVLRRMGDLDGSIARHREAFDIAMERGDLQRAATAISNLSDDQLAAGDVAGAVASAERAVELTRSSGGEGHAYALTNLGMAQSASGRAAAAVENHRRALALARDMSDPVLEASVLSNLGIALRDSGAHDEAVASFERALDIAAALDIAYERGRALLELAESARRRGEASRVRELAEAALQDFPEPDSLERARARALLDGDA